VHWNDSSSTEQLTGKRRLQNILGKKLELSFAELGLGSTMGFIQLPKL